MVSCRISCKAEGLLIVLEYDTAMTMVDGIRAFHELWGDIGVSGFVLCRWYTRARACFVSS